MNSKDLMAIELLKELRDAGVMSFKIEGRSKSIYYLSLITRAYRQAVDDLKVERPFNPHLLEEVNKTANRGFTTAFLVSRSGKDTERMDSPQETDLPQIYGGQVNDEKPGGWMEVDIKNRMEVGDELEYISPQGQYHFTLREMEDLQGAAIHTAHGGNGRVRIRTDGRIEPYALLSIVKTQPCPTV
jgi:putative protease